MKQEFFPFVWDNDVTHQLRRYQIPTSVSLNSTHVQQDVSGILAILEPSFVALLQICCSQSESENF